MSVYGALNEQYMLENIFPFDYEERQSLQEGYQILQEIHFSQKDLQDPKTLDKLLKRAQDEKKIKGVLDALFMILTIFEAWITKKLVNKKVDKVLPGEKVPFLFLGSLVGYATLTYKVTSKLNHVMYATQEKRIKKLREKCVQLIEKLKDSNDPKAKEIIENCKKTIKAIDTYYKKLESKEYKEKLKKYTDYYETFIDIITGKGCFYEGPNYWYYNLAKLAKISPSKFDEGHIKFGETDKKCRSSFNDLWGFDEMDQDSKNAAGFDEFCKIVPELKDGSDVYVYYAIDDTFFIYSPKARHFVYGDYAPDACMWNKSIEPIARKIDYNNTSELTKEDIEFLKVVDAKMGYYLLSEPPEGVERKKL